MFAQKLIIKPVPNTQLVHIVFQSEDPSRAAAIADEVANVYIEQQIEARLQMTAKASGFLSDRVEALRAKLDCSEKAQHDIS